MSAFRRSYSIVSLTLRFRETCQFSAVYANILNAWIGYLLWTASTSWRLLSATSFIEIGSLVEQFLPPWNMWISNCNWSVHAADCVNVWSVVEYLKKISEMHLLPNPVLILTLCLLLFIESDGRVYLCIYFFSFWSVMRDVFFHSHLPKTRAPRSGVVSYPALAQLSAHGIVLLFNMFTV